MKIKIDDQEIMSLNETKKKVIANDLLKDSLHEDCCRRLQWVLMHKYEQCFERLKKEWEPKLKANGVASIPLDNDEFAELVFSQPDYKDREAREQESVINAEQV
jgi:hypothetical protein